MLIFNNNNNNNNNKHNNKLLLLLIIFEVFAQNYLVNCHNEPITNETEAELFLAKENDELQRQVANVQTYSWRFETNITDENKKKSIEVNKQFAAFRKRQYRDAIAFNWTNFKKNTRRQFEYYTMLGCDILDDEDLSNFYNISSQMKTIYSSAKVVHNNKSYSIDPDLSELMRTSTDWQELKSVWVKWRNEAGKPIRQMYEQFYTLGNKGAKLNAGHNFQSMSDIWLFNWESKKFVREVKQLWESVRPLYIKLHAYVRMRLKLYYNQTEHHWPEDGTIPAHILGNMWAQEWTNVLKIIDPYPEISTPDVTDELIKQNYTPLKMFEMADNFYRDLGLLPCTPIFWNESFFVNPKDGREMVCHPSAWDFYKKDDFRIKMCTKVDMKDLITIHHELGHIQYYMQYSKQPTMFRDGANPGFHEAIGDLLALSVSTPSHLQKYSLLKNVNLSDESLLEKITIKHQLKMALSDIALIPWSYLMDLYRWRLFSGGHNYTEANSLWWKMRLEMQGISPPVNRSEDDFDAGAKFHVPANVEYIRYFVANIVKFSFHKALCDIAAPGVPLHKCDIDNSKPAGNKLATILQMGLSRHWSEQLNLLTGSKKLNVDAMIEYFRPISKFLTKQLKKAEEKRGWSHNVTVLDYGFKNSNPAYDVDGD